MRSSPSIAFSAARAAHPAGHARIRELDGFRAVAVLLVLASHLLAGWDLPSEATDWMPRALLLVVSHGWLGVDVFFILSGFLITGILLDEREQPRFFRNFYGRRALRILPLALVCITVWFLAYGDRYGPYFLLALFFSANLHSLFGVATPHGPGVLWSLAVEEHFYLLWPIAVKLLRRRLLVVLALSIVAVSPLLRAWAVSRGMRAGGEVYELSWFRFDGLALGALLALWMRSRFFSVKWTWILIGAGMSTLALATVLTLREGVLAAATPASAALRSPQAQFVCAAALALCLRYQGSALAARLRSRFATVTAKLSYCLYLVHLSIGDFYYWALGRLGIGDVATFGAVGALVLRSVFIVVLSYCVAAVSYRYLEAPAMRLRTYFT